MRGWFWPAAVTVFALVLRLWELGRPRGLSFDERYYAENAWSMLKVGYAQDFVAGADNDVVKVYVDGEYGFVIDGKPVSDIDSVTFTLSANATTVKAKIDSTSTTYTDCTVSGGVNATCDFSPDVAITDADELSVIATS